MIEWSTGRRAGRARHENSQQGGHGPPYGCNPIIEIHRWQLGGGLSYNRNHMI